MRKTLALRGMPAWRQHDFPRSGVARHADRSMPGACPAQDRLVRKVWVPLTCNRVRSRAWLVPIRLL